MTDLQYALIREGTSDDGLIPHISALLLRAGASAVIGAARQYKGSTRERLSQLLAEPKPPALIFVHRDSDSADPSSRHQEIAAAASALGCVERVIPVVPVQELEAWLLTDEGSIRAVVGRPSGRTPMGLPALRNIETTSSPKEVLQNACLIASEKTGVRRKKERGQFNVRRASLLERIDIDGAVTSLASWQRFVGDLTTAAVRALENDAT
ncbi:DUF4276 family protein [Herbiconiux solani]|uniref:DUF4276 family protein n=1 Tax=Herbiconiux solani TaxID=661329 RepID=UPI000A0672B7|nr:DUF4276 family protein [Herbiconiux solani]